MKIKDLLNELENSKEYKKLKEQNQELFFCSAMIILGDSDKVELNFFLPSQNKLSSFSMPFKSLTNHQEEIKDQKEIKNLDLKIDINNLKNYIEEKTSKNFPKIIAILHEKNWNITCLDGMNISRMNIDAYTGEIKKKEEGFLSEMIKFKKPSLQSH